MAATPPPTSDTPVDPKTELLADLDERIASALRAGGPTAPAEGEAQVDPGQVDLLLRLHQLGAAWREKTGTTAGTGPTRIDRFEIVRAVGQGGFATVYEAVDPLLGRRVALKIAHPEALLTPALRRRFLREAELAARLSHPALVTIHDLGESDGVAFIAEELCSGGSLAQWLERHGGPVEPRLAAAVVAALAAGLDVAHQSGIIHRDIKPENVLLTAAAAGGLLPAGHPAEGVAGSAGHDVKLGDFGLGKRDDDSSPTPLSQATRAGATLGTPAWMAPEQIDRGIGAVGPATDVHALGLLLHRLLTGRRRYEGKTDSEILRLILVREQEEAERELRGAPRDLAAVCLRCLARRPGERYARAGELAADLERYLAGVPTFARPLSRWERACRYAARRPRAIAAAAVLVATSLAAAVGLWGWSLEAVAARRRQDLLKEMSAALHLQRGLDDLRAGNVAGCRAQLSTAERLDGALAASFAGRWARRRLHCEQETLFSDPPAGTGPRDVYCLAVSKDGSRIAAGAADGRLILLDGTGHSAPVVVPDAHREINDVAFSPAGDLVATTGQDGRVRLWSAAAGGWSADLAAEPAPLYGVAWSPDGASVAWGGEEGVLVIASRDGRGARRFPVSLAVEPGADGPSDIEAVLFVSDAEVAVAGGHQVLLLDAADGHLIREFEGHAGSVGHLDLSPDGTRLLSAGTDRIPRIWELASGRLLTPLPAHVNWVQGATFTADGTRIVTGCRDGVLQVFDAATGSLVARLPGHDGKTWDVRREPGGTVVSSGADGSLRRWQPTATSMLAGAREHGVALPAVLAVLPTRSAAARTSLPPTAVAIPWRGVAPLLVDLGTGRTIDAPNPAGWSAAVECSDAALESEGFRMAVAENGRDVAIVPLSGSGAPRSLATGGAYRVAWTPSGQLIVGTDMKKGGAIEGWDAGLATSVTIDRLGTFCDALAVAPDGHAVAAADPTTLRVTPIAAEGLPRPTGRPRGLPLDPAFGKIARLAWSPDAGHLAIGSVSGNVSILEAATGRTEHLLRAHRGAVVSLAWSADGRVLVSADADTIHLSDTTTAVTLDTLATEMAVRSVFLTGPADAPERWLVIGGEGRMPVSLADGTTGYGRLVVVDLGR